MLEQPTSCQANLSFHFHVIAKDKLRSKVVKCRGMRRTHSTVELSINASELLNWWMIVAQMFMEYMFFGQLACKTKFNSKCQASFSSTGRLAEGVCIAEVEMRVLRFVEVQLRHLRFPCRLEGKSWSFPRRLCRWNGIDCVSWKERRCMIYMRKSDDSTNSRSFSFGVRQPWGKNL